MAKFLTGVALAGFVALSAVAPAQAQSSPARKVLSGEPAHLQKAKTEKQARADCQKQFKGAKERGSALRTKINFCVQEQMQGN